MNQEQAKAWLPLFQAVAEGKELQMEKEHYQGKLPDFREWCDVDLDYLIHRFNRGYVQFDCVRIKPEPKTKSFCIALMEDQGKYYPMICNNKNDLPCALKFIRWLTDSIEYELPEGAI